MPCASPSSWHPNEGEESKMPECVLKVTGISKSFGGVHALQDVSLSVNAGQVVCLAGENGCGKSTLIKIISGYYEPDAGTIELNGISHSKLTPRESLRAGIQVIYQDFSIFPNLSVAENIALSSLLSRNERHISRKKMCEIAGHALSQIGVDLPLDVPLENLSVADKQIVAITRSLLDNVRMIIMDEPTSALTHKEVQALFRVVRVLKEKGLAILFVSHKLEEIFDICDDISILNNGRNVVSGPIKDFDRSKFVFYMTGREYSEQRLARNVEMNEPLMEVRHLSMEGFFKDVSFKLYPGEVLGITGLLGSGRTELALALYGKRPATSGEILLRGKPVKLHSVKDAIENGISYVPEDRITEGMFLERSILKNIVVSNIAAYSKGVGIVDERETERVADHWVNQLGIKTDNPFNPISTLSGGNQQKVVLAKSLTTSPLVLILNGPTVGVDVGSKMDISRLIQQTAERGVSVLLISDDSTEILTNCKRILMMKNGEIIGEYLGDDFTDASLYRTLIK